MRHTVKHLRCLWVIYRWRMPRWRDDKVAQMLGIADKGCATCGYGSVERNSWDDTQTSVPAPGAVTPSSQRRGSDFPSVGERAGMEPQVVLGVVADRRSWDGGSDGQ